MNNNHYGVIDPEFKALWDSGALAARGLPKGITVEQMIGAKDPINNLSAAESLKLVSESEDFQKVKTQDINIPTSDGSSIPGRIYTHLEATSCAAVIVYFHGGGWLIGCPDGQNAKLAAISCALLEVNQPVIIVNVDYRHVPQFIFPRVYDDGWDGFEYVVNNMAKITDLNANAKIIIAGESAGGGIAAAIGLRELYRVKSSLTENRISGVWLNIPVTCHHDVFPVSALAKGATPSFVQCADAQLLSHHVMSMLWDLLVPDPADHSHQYISPAILPSSTFKGYPMTSIHVAGLDTLRDGGLLFESKLKDAGVDVECIVYPGLPHGFHNLPLTLASTKYKKDLIRMLARLIKTVGP